MELVTQSLSIKEVENVFYARQFAYDILRRFFVQEPSKEYLKEFVQKNMIALFPFKEESEGIREGAFRDIKDIFFSTHDVVNIERHFQELHWDYTRMFIGPFGCQLHPGNPPM